MSEYPSRRGGGGRRQDEIRVLSRGDRGKERVMVIRCNMATDSYPSITFYNGGYKTDIGIENGQPNIPNSHVNCSTIR